MKQALEGTSDQDRQRVADMLKDLNALLDAHARGEDTPEQFAEFMAEHGELDQLAQQAFGGPELADQLAQLGGMLRAARPEQDWESSEDFRGQQGMGLGEATQAMSDIGELERLAEQLS